MSLVDPQSNVESYLANLNGESTPLPLPPESNVEKYLAKMAGVQDVVLPNKPESRVEVYLEQLALNPPSPGEVTVRPLTVTQNGTYSEEDVAYRPVNVNVQPNLVKKTISENGTYKASEDNVDGYSEVEVAIPDPVLDDITITENGVYTSEHDGFDEVTVEVPDPVLDDITITENGVYTSEHDGFDEVTVSVQPPEDSYQLKSMTTPTSLATFEASNMPMPSLKASIKAQQDLHGYDKPWVGGSGKNKAESVINDWSNKGITATKNDDGSYSITGTATESVTSGFLINVYPVSDGEQYIVTNKKNQTDTATKYTRCVCSFYSDSTYKSEINVSEGQTITVPSNVNRLRLSYVWNNGFVVPAGAIIYPMIRLSSVSDATFAPYSNICPISGWDNAIVTDTGINIWDEDWDLGGIDPNTGQNVGGNLVRSKNYIAASADTTYYFKGVGRVFYYDDQKNYISRSDRNNNEFTTPNNCKYIRFRMDASYGTTYNNDISINYPSTDTNYHAYNGVTTTISLGQTVYGGELDVVNGGGTDNFIMETFDGSNDEVWDEDASHCYSVKLNGALQAWKKDVECVSNELEYNGTVSGASYMSNAGLYLWYNPSIVQEPSTRYAMIRNNEMSLAELKAYLAEHPLQVCYELATPTTFTTQPTPIKSLNGTNNLSVDCGEVIEGEYFKAL